MYKVCLTGGPCGGKTTSMQAIEEEFLEKGYNVVIVPEAATLLINSGIRPFGKNALSMYDFQKYVMDMQFYLEEVATKYAKDSNKETIILCDRGLMDDKAYVSLEEYNKLINEFGYSSLDILNRYDLVLHLKSIACDKEELYSNSNNSARTETVDEARLKDAVTLEAWNGHNNLVILDNDCTFEEKINNGISEIYKLVSLDMPLQHQEKYLVDFTDNEFLNKYKTRFDIEQYHVFKDDLEIILRRVVKDEEEKYYEIVKRDEEDGEDRLVKRRMISDREYYSRIPDGIPIKKTRYTFTYNNQYFKLDVFDDGLKLLEVEDTIHSKKRSIPTELEVIDRVDDKYRNSILYKNRNNIKIKKLHE